MPVSGLPNALEFLLESILDKSGLKSWNIFDDKGFVIVKLRFSNIMPPCSNIHEDITEISESSPFRPATFKRKSARMTERDRFRSNEHKQRRIGTRSQTAGVIALSRQLTKSTAY